MCVNNYIYNEITRVREKKIQFFFLGLLLDARSKSDGTPHLAHFDLPRRAEEEALE